MNELPSALIFAIQMMNGACCSGGTRVQRA
jgi:hypothetical protein